MTERADEVRTDELYSAHMQRIHDIVMRWQNGEISGSVKRDWIARENLDFHGPARTDLTTPPAVRDEAALTLAEQAMIPLPAAQAALDAWRDARWASEHAETLEGARAALQRGREAYQDILRSAR